MGDLVMLFFVRCGDSLKMGGAEAIRREKFKGSGLEETFGKASLSKDLLLDKHRNDFSKEISKWYNFLCPVTSKNWDVSCWVRHYKMEYLVSCWKNEHNSSRKKTRSNETALIDIEKKRNEEALTFFSTLYFLSLIPKL